MPQRPHPETLRAAAIGYASLGIPILPDQPDNRWPDPVAGPPVCTCRRRDCPGLPVHLPRHLDLDGSARHARDVGRYWTATPDAAVATVAGAAFDVIEIHTALGGDLILDWLSAQDLPPGPILRAGLGRLQLLAVPDSYQPDRYDSATAAILYLPTGSLILLPPSPLNDGQSVSWLRSLDPGAELPDGAELFFALVELPTNRQLANAEVYTFPAVRQHCRTG